MKIPGFSRRGWAGAVVSGLAAVALGLAFAASAQSAPAGTGQAANSSQQQASPTPIEPATPVATEPAAASVAFVIGDSQAHGAGEVPPEDTWVHQGLSLLGYEPLIFGAGGTGFVADRPATAESPAAGNYLSAYEAHAWPAPPRADLIVVEGGGNDRDTPDADIQSAATRLVTTLQSDYPMADIVVVGPIGDGAGRRAEISRIIGLVATSSGVTFIDSSTWRTDYDLTQYAMDAVHLHQPGHDAAGTVFAEELRSAGVPDAR